MSATVKTIKFRNMVTRKVEEAPSKEDAIAIIKARVGGMCRIVESRCGGETYLYFDGRFDSMNYGWSIGGSY